METKQTTFHYDGTNIEELRQFVLENGGTIEETENLYILRKQGANGENYKTEISKNEKYDICSENLRNMSSLDEAAKRMNDIFLEYKKENEKFSAIIILSDGEDVASLEKGKLKDLLVMLDSSDLGSIKKYIEIKMIEKIFKPQQP